MKKMNELVDLAIKATPGPWEAATDWERAAVYSTNKHAYPENKRVVCSGNQNNHKRFNNEPWSGSDWNDAAFIAAANPATILAIAEKFQSLERRVEAAEAEVQRLNATAQPVSDGWVKCSERMPNPEYARRVCAFTPSEHPDLKLRLVSSDLFKTVCRSATHWIYVDEPAAPGGQDA